MDMNMRNKWKNILGAISVACLLIVGTVIVVHPAISELAGLAVAQSVSQWNSVIDASKGDAQGSGIVAGSPYLFNGLTFDRLRGTPASDAASGTGFLGAVAELFNGTTYDRIRGGLTADAQATTGMVSNQPFVFNGSTFDRLRGSSAADGAATTGILSIESLVFNASTWDRMRTSSADALAITGITATGQEVWNGASFDRQRSASATNNIATTSLGGVQVTPLSTWSVVNTTSGATAATVTKASGGGTVRHVVTGITACFADSAVNVTAPLVSLLDGATPIRTWIVGSSGVAGGTECVNVTGLNMTGTAATAMNLTFAVAPAATATETVTLTGYSTP